RDNLHVVMSDSGLPKMVFNSEAPLSGPQSGPPDSIARDFLADHSAMFGLNRNQILEMNLKNEDIDGGTTFLNYEQEIDGVPVFQGHLQVAVNRDGQVMSVNQGPVIPGTVISTIPTLPEVEGLQKAFEFAGRQAPASFNMVKNRLAKGDRAVYRNPLCESCDD